MQDIAKPRRLDAAAEVFLAMGRFDAAATTVGAALAAEYSKVRDPDLQAVPEKAIETLGRTEADKLIAEGASQSIDEALAAVRHWLLDA